MELEKLVLVVTMAGSKGPVVTEKRVMVLEEPKWAKKQHFYNLKKAQYKKVQHLEKFYVMLF